MVIFQSDLSFAPLDRMLFFILVFVGGKKTGRNSYELLLTSFSRLQKSNGETSIDWNWNLRNVSIFFVKHTMCVRESDSFLNKYNCFNSDLKMFYFSKFSKDIRGILSFWTFEAIEKMTKHKKVQRSFK